MSQSDGLNRGQIKKECELKGKICLGRRFDPKEASEFSIQFSAFGAKHASIIAVERLRAHVRNVVGKGEFSFGTVSLKMGDAILLLKGPLKSRTILHIKRTAGAFEMVNHPISESHAKQLRHS